MKHITLFAALVLAAFQMQAQMVSVTFNVNMASVTNPDVPHLAGGADFGIPGDNPMTDDDGDGIWTITVEVASGYTGYYTFTNGACPDWGCKENIAGQDCAHPENYNDRQLENITENTVINTCFGQCSTDGSCAVSGGPLDVTFRVDMTNEDVAGPIFLTGGASIDGWCGTCVEMLDADGDNIYEVTVEMPQGAHEYKFNNGGWDGTENLESEADSACTLTTIDGENTFVNRLFSYLPGAGDVTLDPVCFEACAACEPVVLPPTPVTFNVDMSEQTVSGAVYISGESIDGWAGASVELTDADGDNVYSVTLELEQGDHEYKYMIGSWDTSEQLDAVGDSACTITTGGFTNRFLSITSEEAIDLATVCYESCEACIIDNVVENNPMAFRVFPTVTDGVLTVVFPAALEGQTNLVVRDLSGRQVRTENLGAGTLQTVVDLGQQPNGFYIIRVENGAHTATETVIVQH